MESSMTVVKTTSSENPNKVDKVNLDVVQCNTEKNKGRDSLSVKMLNKLKIRENDKPPKIDEIKTNKIGKKDKDWIRVEVIMTKDGKKNKPLGTVSNNYYKKALDNKLEIARKRAALKRDGKDHA